MSTGNLINVLYVDDEVHNLNSFNAAFRRYFNIFTATSAVEGREILDKQLVHVILADQRMPGLSGIEFLESVIPQHPDPIRILLTGYEELKAVVDAINRGEVYRYVQKPWQDDELKINIEKAFEIYSLRKENRELINSLSEANKQLKFLLRQSLL